MNLKTKTMATTQSKGLFNYVNTEIESTIAGLKNIKIHFQEVFKSIDNDSEEQHILSQKAFENVQRVAKAIRQLENIQN